MPGGIGKGVRMLPHGRSSRTIAISDLDPVCSDGKIVERIFEIFYHGLVELVVLAMLLEYHSFRPIEC